MREPLVVYVDTVSVAMAERIAEKAALRGIRLALICPTGSAGAGSGAITRVIETDDFSLARLEEILGELERTYAVRGVHTFYGPFRPEGFVHETVAALASARGLAHCPADALYRATNKYLTRDALRAAGVRTVDFGIATDEASLLEHARRIGFPLILKPVTGIGSSLILKCRDEAEATDRLRFALRALPDAYYPQLRMAPHRFHQRDGRAVAFDPARSMLVERYIDGREASVECLLAGDRILPLVVHDKVQMDEGERVVYEQVLVTPPERFTAAEVDELRDYAVSAVRALGLRNMFCHVELRYEDGAGPQLLEVNTRIGGGCVVDSLETFTGLDVDAVQLSLILGETEPPPVQPRSSHRHAMIFLFSPRSGVLRGMSGLDEVLRLPGVRSIRVGHGPGDRIGGDCEEVFMASIWLKAADAASARQTYERIRELVQIDVQ